VGLKPSRGRISFGPMLDENGFGLATNFVQTKSVRDTAAMLDCLAVPQPGDPFVIAKPAEPYATLATRAPQPLRIALTTTPLMGLPVDPGVVAAVRETGQLLAGMGHHVEEVTPQFDGLAALRQMMDIWFFGFDARIALYASRTGLKPGPDTLEPVVLAIWEHACRITPARFQAALAGLNSARRTLGRLIAPYDVWLTPTTTRTAEPWGNYNLGRTDVPYDAIAETLYRPIAQFTLPHNIMGTPALSLPLAMHADGLPIGVQLGAKPAQEHLLLQLATQLEAARPWAQRVPPLHVSKVTR
jgi:amidase